jgi:hypothetical protein
MKRSQTLPGVAALLMLSWVTACAENQQGKSGENAATFAAADKVTYKESDFRGFRGANLGGA